MTIEPAELERILRRGAGPKGAEACLFDADARIIAKALGSGNAAARENALREAAAEALRRGAARPAENTPASADGQAEPYALRIGLGEEPWGAVAVLGPPAEARTAAAAIKAAVEALIDRETQTERTRDGIGAEPYGKLLRMLISGGADQFETRRLVDTLDLDPYLQRAAVCVRLDFKKNSFFNLNLNLGYQSESERIRAEIIDRIRAMKYLNSQDACAAVDAETVLLAKAFLGSGDPAKVHRALDKICAEIAEMLKTEKAVSFSLASGKAYPDIFALRTSFAEAMELIGIGDAVNSGGGYYRPEELLFETVHHFMNDLMKSNIVEPYFDRLPRKDGKIRTEILDCAELFVDCCMNVSTAGRVGYLHRNTIGVRLQKFSEATGLRPAASFKDAFIVKMLALRAREENLS